MANDRKDQPQMPLLQQYNKSPELSVSHIYKLQPEELRYAAISKFPLFLTLYVI